MFIVEFVSYVGTWVLTESSAIYRTQQVRHHLINFRSNHVHCEGTPVLIVISLAGIKVCSPNRQTTYMAHALRRISYATCDARHRQFAFVAREPRDASNSSYCHAFLTQTSQQAEELNNIVGSAFRMAYVAQFHSQQQQQQQNQQQQQQQQQLQKPGTTLVISGTDPCMKSIKCNSSSSLTTSCSDHHSGKTNASSNHSWMRTSHDNVLHNKPSSTSSLTSSNSSEEDNTSTVSPTEMNQCRSWPCKPEPTKSFLNNEHPSRSTLVNSSHSAGYKMTTTDLACASDSSSHSSTSDKRIGKNELATLPPLPDGSHHSRLLHSFCKSHYPPPLPTRTDSLSSIEEESLLKCAPWFQAGIPREIALEILSQEPIGAFLVRQSTSKPGCYALSLRVPKDFQTTGIAHYLILQTHRGYKIKGFTKEFPSLTSLIVHHSVMPELLPCPLLLSRHSTNPGFQDSDSNDFADIDSDPDYNTLSDFRRKMADLNV